MIIVFDYKKLVSGINGCKIDFIFSRSCDSRQILK